MSADRDAAERRPVQRDLLAEVVLPRRSLPGRVSLYFHTVRHLLPGQIAWQLKRRLFPPGPPAAAPAATLREGLPVVSFLAPPEPDISPGEIRFVGQARPFPGQPPAVAAMDWAAADAPKLWRYNQHYFDYLGWLAFSDALKAALIDDWIARVPVGAEDAWEPYPVSLRIVNWLKYALTLGSGALAKQWVASLARQTAALEGDLEYHLLANHLLKNGKALVFAGVCLEGPAPARWLGRGLDIVLAEAEAQILSDGGHAERSPMYHCIVLEDYLDVVNLLTLNPGLATADQLGRLHATARRAMEFLRVICNGADEIPLFNDAAFGITRPATEVLAYAERVLGAPAGAAEAAPAGARIFLPDTGYYGYRQGGDSLIIDGGPVGPDYQPGHAHCDTLSYELHVAGVPVIVDSGTFDYEPGPLRHYLRSTAAHNTVRIDGEEQSEIWGQFRVGRRARPRAVTLGPWVDGRMVFAGEHDGYDRLPGAPIHRRGIVMESRGRWEVRDVIAGRGEHRVESFLHLHPGIRLEPAGTRAFRLVGPHDIALSLVFGPVGTIELATGYYCPEFGKRLESRSLVIRYAGSLPVELSYSLDRLE